MRRPRCRSRRSRHATRACAGRHGRHSRAGRSGGEDRSPRASKSRAFNAPLKVNQAALTDGNGRYEITGLPAGRYVVTFSRGTTCAPLTVGGGRLHLARRSKSQTPAGHADRHRTSAQWRHQRPHPRRVRRRGCHGVVMPDALRFHIAACAACSRQARWRSATTSASTGSMVSRRDGISSRPRPRPLRSVIPPTDRHTRPPTTQAPAMRQRRRVLVGSADRRRHRPDAAAVTAVRVSGVLFDSRGRPVTAGASVELTQRLGAGMSGSSSTITRPDVCIRDRRRRRAITSAGLVAGYCGRNRRGRAHRHHVGCRRCSVGGGEAPTLRGRVVFEAGETKPRRPPQCASMSSIRFHDVADGDGHRQRQWQLRDQDQRRAHDAPDLRSGNADCA